MEKDSLIIEKLIKQKEILQHTIDSIQLNQKLNELAYKVDNQNQIIAEVNSFYDSAWLKLIFVITLLGVIIPIIAQYFQRKNFKDLTSFIDSQLKDSFDTKLNELKEYNETRMKASITNYENKINNLEQINQKTLIELDASTYYLQGRALFLENNWIGAIASHSRSALAFSKCNKPERTLPQLVNIKRSLNKIKNINDLNKIDNYLEKSEINTTLEGVLEILENDLNKEIFKVKIDEIKVMIEKIKATNNV